MRPMKLSLFTSLAVLPCMSVPGLLFASVDQPYSVQVSSIGGVAVSSATAEVVEPFLSPVGKGKVKVVSPFGKRPVPTDPTKTKMEMHEGVDFATAPGTPVRVARSGQVLFAGFSKAYASRADKTDQSHLVIVRHADRMSTRYVHLNSLKVRSMQEVLAGDIVGTAGESDEWTEPVLHFEIRAANGKALNPKLFLAEVKR